MSIEVNKENARRVMEEIINRGNLSLADELFATDYVCQSSGMPDMHGPDGFKQFVSVYRTAFPDIHMTNDGAVGEGDTVVNLWTMRGTHRGELAGIPATGKQVTLKGTVTSWYRDGKQVKAWMVVDQLDMLQQLGVAPQMKQAVA